MILYMIEWHIMEMLKHMSTAEQIEANITRVSQNSELAANIVTIQIATKMRVTLEDVTMLGYWSGI